MLERWERYFYFGCEWVLGGGSGLEGLDARGSVWSDISRLDIASDYREAKYFDTSGKTPAMKVGEEPRSESGIVPIRLIKKTKTAICSWTVPIPVLMLETSA